MIHKINHESQVLAKQIREVFQASYPIEAAFLNAKFFPPLHRKLEEFTDCGNEFFGYYKNEELVAVMEIKDGGHFTHIQSLVVHPSFFRMGIASELILFVFEHYDTPLIMVETGAGNRPAIALYKKHGFRKVKEFDTKYGIRKVRFEKVNTR